MRSLALLLCLMILAGCAKDDPVTGELISLRDAKKITVSGTEWMVMEKEVAIRSAITYISVVIQNVNNPRERFRVPLEVDFKYWGLYEVMIEGDTYTFELEPQATPTSSFPYDSPAHHLKPVPESLVSAVRSGK